MADKAIGQPLRRTDRHRVEEDRERFAEFKTNPVRSATTDPVSTFSIDVDTASYSFVRRSLKEGFLPQADTVRVEEMINYFPYDWQGPDSAATPFNSTVTVMPTPWNEHTKLMHVAIKGYDIVAGRAAEGQSRLPARRLRLDERSPTSCRCCSRPSGCWSTKLNPDDTVSIVTYAGNAGTVLEPTKVSEQREDPDGDRHADARRLDGRRGGHPRGLSAGRTVLRQGRRQPRHARHRRRLQCRPERRRRSQAHHRGEAQVRRLPVGVRLRPRQPQRPDDADHRAERQRHGGLYRHAGRGREGAGRRMRPRRSSRSPRTSRSRSSSIRPRSPNTG